MNEQPIDHARTLRVSHPLAQAITLGAALLFLFFAILGFRSGQVLSSILLLAVAAYSVFGFLEYGSTEMDNRGVTHISLLGRFYIAWDEIRVLEADPGANTIVFKGVNKQVVIPGFPLWHGADKKPMASFMRDQLAQRHVPTKNSSLAAFAISRNSRVN